MVESGQFIQTVNEVMSMMAPHAGGSIPDTTQDEYAQWLLFIQQKYEEASRRGFWRRLLTRDDLSLTAGDTEALLPVKFQRANSLYILYVDEVDLSDPDRVPDDQSIWVEMDNNIFLEDGETANTDFGRWKVTFTEAIETTQTAPIWYFATPPKPTLAADKLLLPGDMIAYGALAEVFRSTNLEGSEDNAKQEFENRLSTYLAMEMVPERHEILTFSSNPQGINRTTKARNQYLTRHDRIRRSY